MAKKSKKSSPLLVSSSGDLDQKENIKKDIKRPKKKINSFLDYPGDEWLLDETTALNKTLDALKSFQFNKQNHELKILIPGVGRSKIAFDLFNNGYSNLTIVDIESEALEFQRNLFNPPASSENIESKAESRDTVTIQYCDILNLNPCEFPQAPFDVIVDKGFLDVFLRQGSVRAAWSAALSLLSAAGVLVAFSMFHAKWRRLLARKEWRAAFYSSVEVRRFSRTRPTVARFSNPIAFLIAVRDNSTVHSLVESETLKDFYKIQMNEFPSDASEF